MDDIWPAVRNAGKKTGFRDAFRKATREKTRAAVKVPDFPLETIADYYTYYCLIIGIPEGTFWESDEAFLASVAADKTSYDGWLSYAQRKEVEARGKR